MLIYDYMIPQTQTIPAEIMQKCQINMWQNAATLVSLKSAKSPRNTGHTKYCITNKWRKSKEKILWQRQAYRTVWLAPIWAAEHSNAVYCTQCRWFGATKCCPHVNFSPHVIINSNLWLWSTSMTSTGSMGPLGEILVKSCCSQVIIETYTQMTKYMHKKRQ